MSADHQRDSPTDAELLRAIARGEAAALGRLYDRRAPILFGLLLRMIPSRPEAEDLLQEVFFQVWQKAGDFDERRGRAVPWLTMLARSRALDRLRSLGLRERAVEEIAREVPDGIPDAAQEAVQSEEREIVRRALAEIPEAQREVLLLAYFGGLSQSEIAERLGRPLGTVKTQTRTGLVKLRELVRR